MLANQLLGYTPDTRLLIVNADDFGLCASVNEAVLATLSAGIVRSATLMAPCPGAAQAIGMLAAHPEVAFGIHLTAICDNVIQRWGPMAPRAEVASLLDEEGCFFSNDRRREFLARARIEELKIEWRAQIEQVLATGLRPTHLDFHCLYDGGRPDIMAMTLGLAHQYGLAMRVAAPPWTVDLQARGVPTLDHGFVDSSRLPTAAADKADAFARLLLELPPGLTEWAVHPGLDTPDLRATQPATVVFRQSDCDFLMSPAARHLVEAAGVTLLDYRPLQAAWAL